MRLCYRGNPLFNANAAEVTSDTTLIRAESGRPLRYSMRIRVRGFLEGTSQADLTAKENNLRIALLNPYGDLVLQQDSGANSGLALTSNNSITGVVIERGPTFSEAQGAEYTNYRTVEFEGSAEYLVPNADTAIVSWKETFSFVGTCGPVTAWRRAVNAGPVQQQIYPASTMRVTQVGRAVGHRVVPPVPPPRFSYPIELVDRRRIVPESPQRTGPGAGALVNYGISWEYTYESDSPLAALPGLPPF
jgi:hypothetical protein